MKAKEYEISGFSVVEVLVATAITLLVMAGVFGAFKSLSDVNVAASQAFDRSQNLQTVLNMIRRDIQRVDRNSVPEEGLPIPGNVWTAINRCVVNNGTPGACPNPIPAINAENVLLLPAGTSSTGRDPVILNGANFVFDAITPLTVNGRNAISILYTDSFARDIPVTLTNNTPGFIGASLQAAASANMQAGFQTIEPGDFIKLNNDILQYVEDFQFLTPRTLRFGGNEMTGINQQYVVPLAVVPNLRITLMRRVTYYLQDLPDEEDPVKTVTWLMRQVNLRPAVQLIPGVVRMDLDYDIAIAGGGAITSTNVASPTALQIRDIRMVNITIENESLKPGADKKLAASAVTTSVAVRRFTDRYQ